MLHRLSPLAAVLLFGLSPSIATASEVDWSGFHGGFVGGYSWGVGEPANGAPTQHPAGPLAGIGAGFDIQFDGGLVVGVLGDLVVGSVADSVLDGNYLVESGKLDYLTTLRGRLGYAAGRFLPYVTGGVAWAATTASLECLTTATHGICAPPSPFAGLLESDSATAAGWTAGLGVEYAVSDHWSVKAEYLYADFGNVSYELGDFGTAVSRMVSSTATFGINYRF